MSKTPFDPAQQQKDVTSKIVAGLERVSEAFKVMLWEKAKTLGLSPIQIQILIFIAYHKSEWCNVSHLAREFNVSKPTISDAVRMLEQKKLILKDFSQPDSRSYLILLSAAGKKVVEKTEDFANPLRNELKQSDTTELADLFQSLSQLIYRLNQSGILTIQRTCYGCRFFSQRKRKNFCNLLNVELASRDIRVDCPEYAPVGT
ncbi:MAG TPA: MarR family winged helix-turn-helix transcriptional regulator [Cyclobacteriaceae bacterium]|nr:MarR family winged helix-turn-helix transcriptional regulator [Cyclobacteriaceae bacterium]